MNCVATPIDLDHNATTPPDPAVVREVVNCLEQGWGNPSSLHAYGQEAARILELARARVAALVAAPPEQVIFTSGGTEANNQVLLGLLLNDKIRGRHIVTTAIEHQAVLHPCERLEALGWQVTRVLPDADGVVSAAAVAAALRPDTALVSVMLANNETGVLQPVRALAESAHAMGVLVHTDAVQAVGKIPVNFQELGVDFMSFSAHKFYGPKGVGALCCRTRNQAPALLYGGHQEQGLRGGTENLPGIAGFGRAAELAANRLAADITQITRLRESLETGLREICPLAVINGASAPRLSNTCSVTLPGYDNTALMLNLDLIGVAVSTGSACTASNRAPSPVLVAMGMSQAQARNTLRFSLGRGNTAAEIDRALSALRQLLSRLPANG